MIDSKSKDKSRITIHELSTFTKYKHTLEFRNIYEETSRELTKKNSKLDRENQTIRNDRFNTAANSLKYHLETILNSL
jgi:hypothetical protein